MGACHQALSRTPSGCSRRSPTTARSLTCWNNRIGGSWAQVLTFAHISIWCVWNPPKGVLGICSCFADHVSAPMCFQLLKVCWVVKSIILLLMIYQPTLLSEVSINGCRNIYGSKSLQPQRWKARVENLTILTPSTSSSNPQRQALQGLSCTVKLLVQQPSVARAVGSPRGGIERPDGGSFGIGILDG